MEMIEIAVFIFIFGLIMGSFLNVCISRIPEGESIAYPPSHCSSCNNVLKPWDLIPLLSYITLKGRCRYCGEKLSLEYPALELSCGLLYIILYWVFGPSFLFIKGIIFVSLGLVIGIIDFKTQDVYTSTTLAGGAIVLLIIVIEAVLFKVNPISYILGAVAGAAFIGLIVFLTRGMGEGDIEIAALCGAFLGLKLSIMTIFIALLLGGIAGAFILLSKKKKRGDSIAFGPFLILGASISMVIGEKLIEYYLKLF